MTGVSRFTAAKLADLSTEVMGPNVVAGSFSRRATRPATWTSPANANVMSAEAATGWRCVMTGLARSAVVAACRLGALLPQAAASIASRALVVTMSSRRITTDPSLRPPDPFPLPGSQTLRRSPAAPTKELPYAAPAAPAGIA